MGLLKAKFANYRSQLLEPSKKGEKDKGFDVLKSGDCVDLLQDQEGRWRELQFNLSDGEMQREDGANDFEHV